MPCALSHARIVYELDSLKRLGDCSTMRVNFRFGLLVTAVSMQCGCATNSGAREKGPDGTVAYSIHVESSEPGARIEINDDNVGVTPMDIKVFGDRDGTFHNFGSSDFVIRVHPVRQGQSVQAKIFRTGGWFAQEDRIPSRLYFDLNQKAESFSIDPVKPRY